MQSVVATWQYMSNKSPPCIHPASVIAYPEVSLGLRLDHSYGLILELSELHICTHYPVIDFMRPSLHTYYIWLYMYLDDSNCLSAVASMTVLMSNSSHTSAPLK